MASRERIIEILTEVEAFLEGHFLLSSEKHSNGYVQCAKLLRYADLSAEVLENVTEQIKDMKFDLIVGPAMGGIIVAYELGRQLNKEAIFTEREDGMMKLRRGFEIKPGSKVIIAEDVITTGKSSMEVKEIIEGMGAEVIALVSIVDRRSENEKVNLPVYSAVKLDINTYDAENCPICKTGKELVKPGSRKIIK